MDDVKLNSVSFFGYYTTLLHLYRLKLNEMGISS
jgi:hypothetical protein